MKARNPLPFATPPSNGSRILLEGTSEVLGLFLAPTPGITILRGIRLTGANPETLSVGRGLAT